MGKKYTLQLVNFQIKTYYHKALLLLKKNRNVSLYDSTNYKRIIFKHFIRICSEEKDKMLRKANVFSFFARILQLKSVYYIIKLRLTRKKEAKRLRCHFLSFQLKSFYQQLTDNASVLIRRNHFNIQYNIFFVKRMYIAFFKSVCKYISSKSKRMKQYNDANELYLFKLSIKAIKKLKENVLIRQKRAGILLRKRVLMRIYYKNLKSMVYEYKQRCHYYRCIHLKKYYFNRLSRVIKAIGNNRIASLKFISKWIMIWKELILKNKRSRAEGVVLLSRVLDKIRIKFIVKFLKAFYIKLKDKTRSILKQQINEIKCSKLIALHLKRLKYDSFKELKHNRMVNKYVKRKQMLLTKAILQMLKFIKDTSIPMYLKNEEAVDHCKKRTYKTVIKPYLNMLRKNASATKAKLQFFRVTMLKIKIFKFLKGFKAKSKKESNRREGRFRRYFLLNNYMNMLKKHSLIMYRENKILSGIRKKITKDRISYMKWGFRSMRNNLIVKRHKRRKMFKLIIQVFTALKMLSLKNGYRLSDGSENYNDENNNNEDNYYN